MIKYENLSKCGLVQQRITGIWTTLESQDFLSQGHSLRLFTREKNIQKPTPCAHLKPKNISQYFGEILYIWPNHPPNTMLPKARKLLWGLLWNTLTGEKDLAGIFTANYVSSASGSVGGGMCHNIKAENIIHKVVDCLV